MKREHICFYMQKLAFMSDLNMLINETKTTVLASEFYVEYCSEVFVLCVESSDYYCYLLLLLPAHRCGFW